MPLPKGNQEMIAVSPESNGNSQAQLLGRDKDREIPSTTSGFTPGASCGDGVLRIVNHHEQPVDMACTEYSTNTEIRAVGAARNSGLGKMKSATHK
jgi:hypothetical protein